MRKYRNKIIAGVIIVVVLVFIYWWGGSAPGLRGWTGQTEQANSGAIASPEPMQTPESVAEQEQNSAEQTADEAVAEERAGAEESKPQSEQGSPKAADESGSIDAGEVGGKDEYRTEPVPEGKPEPVEPQSAVISDKQLTCTLSVRCDTILDNKSWLDAEKAELIPEDGIILAEQPVTFYEGESVFNLLVREMKRNKIHLEFENTPVYNSAYIEGIGNIYEFDCGELSGWMYRVNGWFPNYGCSRYLLREGDRVEWVYTCDLGADVGGGYSTRNGK